jgi:iron complex outermembrane recepter protein
VLQDAVEPDLSNFLLQNTGLTLEQIFGSGLLPGNYSYRANDTTHDRQIAGFGQIDYEVIDRLTLTAGVRVARQSNDFSLMFDGPVNGGQTVSRGNESEHVTTPKYGISYQLTDRNLLYVSVAKGNRMGGANSPFFPLPGCTEQLAAIGVSSSPGAYKSDSVWSYEIGSKNRLFNNRLQIDASIFHLDWSNMQQNINVPACASSFTANVGKATSKGFDLVINAQATDHVKAGLAVGYVNARIAQTTGIPGGVTFVSDGDQVDANQSPWTVSGNVEYDFIVLDGQPAYVRVDDEFRSKNPGPFSFNDPNSASNKPGQPVNPSTNVVNLRLGTLVHGWDISIFGSNLANSHPLLNVTPETSLAPLGHAYTMQPRTIGLTSIYRW